MKMLSCVSFGPMTRLSPLCFNTSTVLANIGTAPWEVGALALSVAPRVTEDTQSGQPTILRWA